MAGNKPKGLENSKYVKMVKMPARSLTIVGLNTSDGDEHPDYDSRSIDLPIDDAMKASIAAEGVNQVVHICVVDGQPVVIDGRQRVRTCWAVLDDDPKNEHAAEITCKVWRLNAAERARFAVRANAHRRNDDQVTEGEKAARLVAMGGITDEQICQDFGWGIGTLRNRLNLVDGILPKSVLNMVKAGKLLVTAAIKLRASIKAGDMTGGEALDEARKLSESGTSKQSTRTTTSDGTERPGVRLMAKIVANEESAKESDRHLEENVRQALKWVLGKIEAGSIKGLSAAVRDTRKKAPPKPPAAGPRKTAKKKGR